jgi:hypothetical protein
VRDVRLIDFARARHDHVLHDFFRLETEVVTKILPVGLMEAELPAETIGSLYRQLHSAAFGAGRGESVRGFHPALGKTMAILHTLRQAAREGLYRRDDATEYYEGLALYLISALKFRGLSTLAKQAAFWAAATAVDLLSCPARDACTTRSRQLNLSVGITPSFSIRVSLRVRIDQHRGARVALREETDGADARPPRGKEGVQ